MKRPAFGRNNSSLELDRRKVEDACMSLDLTVIETNGRPGDSFALNPEQHHELLGGIDTGHFPLVSRMTGYYCDADYDSHELPDLAAEFSVLRPLIEDKHYAALIDEIQKLLAQAIDRKLCISAIAD